MKSPSLIKLSDTIIKSLTPPGYRKHKTGISRNLPDSLIISVTNNMILAVLGKSYLKSSKN